MDNIKLGLAVKRGDITKGQAKKKFATDLAYSAIPGSRVAAKGIKSIGNFLGLAEGGSVPQYNPGGSQYGNSVQDAARNLTQYGQGGDSTLAHLSAPQANYLGKNFGGDVNPYTGLPQFGLLDRIRGAGREAREMPGRALEGMRSLPGRMSAGASRLGSYMPWAQKGQMDGQPAPMGDIRAPLPMPGGPAPRVQMSDLQGIPLPPPMPGVGPRVQMSDLRGIPLPPPMPGVMEAERGPYGPAPAVPPMGPPGYASPSSVSGYGAPMSAGLGNPMAELQQRFASGSPMLQPGRDRAPEVDPRPASGGAGGYGSVMGELQGRLGGGAPMLRPGRDRAPEVPGPGPLTGFPALMQELNQRNQAPGYYNGGPVGLGDSIQMLEDDYY
jgi:hypothetical protein